MIEARFKLDDHTKRVLDVIKGKYGLSNRNDALKQLVELEGDKYVEPTANESVLKELDEEYETHKKKHKNRRMDDKELRGLLNV